MPDHLRFARGFTMARHDLALPRPGWLAGRAGPPFVTRDPSVPLRAETRGDSFVAALGTIWDGRRADGSEQEAAAALLAALDDSEEAFLDTLGAMSGRFVLACGADGRAHVCGDATMTRSVCHAPAPPGLVSPHGELVAEAVGASRSAAAKAVMATDQWKRPQFRHLLGAIAEWEGMRFLTANMARRLDDGTTRRIGPRHAIERIEVEAAVDAVEGLMRRQMAWLAATGRPLVQSLTAGIDSRLAFAIAKDVDGIRYFTYSNGTSKAHLEDAAQAAEMTSAFGLSHEVVPVDETEDPTIPDIVRSNNRVPHLPHVASAHLEQVPQDALHVRSNLAEIGRAYYRKAFDRAPFDAEAMADTWCRMAGEPAAVAAFADWSEKVGFDRVVAEHGIEAPDLFYWAPRMSCWHGRVVLESDLAFDKVSLFDNRLLLQSLLGVPRCDRIDAAPFVQVMRRAAPELLHWPVNGAPLLQAEAEGVE